MTNHTFGWSGVVYQEWKRYSRLHNPKYSKTKYSSFNSGMFSKTRDTSGWHGADSILTCGLVLNQIWHIFRTVPLKFIFCSIRPCVFIGSLEHANFRLVHVNSCDNEKWDWCNLWKTIGNFKLEMISNKLLIMICHTNPGSAQVFQSGGVFFFLIFTQLSKSLD